MANKTISNYTAQAAFNGTDQVLFQRSSNYYKILASDILDHLDTDDLTEGSSNLYATTSNLNTWLATKDSDDLSEGSTNLYATTSNLNTWFGTKTLDNVANGITNMKPSLHVESITDTEILSMNTTPIQILAGGATYKHPIAAVMVNTGGATAYTITSITELQIFASNGMSSSSHALFTAHPEVLTNTNTYPYSFGLNDVARVGSGPSWNWYLKCDGADPTLGNLNFDLHIYYFDTQVT